MKTAASEPATDRDTALSLYERKGNLVMAERTGARVVELTGS